MAKAAKQSSHANPIHLVMRTGEAHPPFVQEISPGVLEKCVWDDTINGYRCSIIHDHNAA